MEELQNYLIDLAKGYLPKFALALVTLVIGFWIVGIVMRVVKRTLKKNFQPEIQGLLKSIVSIVLKTIVLISVISILGIETTSFVAVFGLKSQLTCYFSYFLC